jgi:HPt (histidine-containing phosphotransfer) domain-containing protein
MNSTIPPVIDPHAIEELRALNPEDPGFLRELVDLFVQDVPDRLAEIAQSLATKDAVLLTRAAHTIKGSCSNFGASKLQEISHTMELQGKAGAFADAAVSLVTLRAEFATVATALKQIS